MDRRSDERSDGMSPADAAMIRARALTASFGAHTRSLSQQDDMEPGFLGEALDRPAAPPSEHEEIGSAQGPGRMSDDRAYDRAMDVEDARRASTAEHAAAAARMRAGRIARSASIDASVEGARGLEFMSATNEDGFVQPFQRRGGSAATPAAAGSVGMSLSQGELTGEDSAPAPAAPAVASAASSPAMVPRSPSFGAPGLSREDEHALFSTPSMAVFPPTGGIAGRLMRMQSGSVGSEAQSAAASASGKPERGSSTVGPAGAPHWLRAVPAEQDGSFQRVQISGSESLAEEEEDACRYVARALRLRQKHVYKKPVNYWGSVQPDVAPHVARRSMLFTSLARNGSRSLTEAVSALEASEPEDPVAAAVAAVSGKGVAAADFSTSKLSMEAPKLTDAQLASLLGLAPGADVSRYRELFHRRRAAVDYNPLDVPVPGRASNLAHRWVDGVVHVVEVAGGGADGGKEDEGAGDNADEEAEDMAEAEHEAARVPIAEPRSPGRSRSRHRSHSAAPDVVYGPNATLEEFLADYGELCKIVHAAHVKSFAWLRLQLLEKRFDLHRLLNGQLEADEQKTVPHRDFYNVRKIDTHVHHSACMNQKHLLRFIKHKLRTAPDEVVCRTKDGTPETLAEVFAELGLSAYDLSVDTLDMQADHTTYHRFDRFNLKYNPIGQSKLRTVFLKSDNELKGRYLAEVTKEVFNDLEASKYQFAEYRISIYGRKATEWGTLAAWVVDNNLVSPNVRWLIQVPRLFQLYRSSGMLGSFQEMLEYLFEPLFRVTLDPASDPKLHAFLATVVGFDCVDDESKQEGARDAEVPHPSEWDMPFNPPYFYWTYYLSSNLAVLNRLRESRGMSTFSFRPHGGEAGDGDHLAACFLTAESVNHGITMRRSPTLQYLFYLDQVGLAMSPLSNNRLFLDYAKNPFFKYFQRGLNVSLSTDDPLLLHYTREALVEEYCVAAQVFKLTAVDLCEVARASVLQSGFEHPYKAHFIGESYALPGPRGNDIFLTNVPSVRLQYRLETLRSERALVAAGARSSVTARLATSDLTSARPAPPPPVTAPAPAVAPSPRAAASSSARTPASRNPAPTSAAIAGAVRTPARSTAAAQPADPASAPPAAGSRGRSTRSRPVLGRPLSPVSRGLRASVRVRSSKKSVDGRSYTVYSVPGDEPTSPKAAVGTPGAASAARPFRGRRADEDDSAVRGGRI